MRRFSFFVRFSYFVGKYTFMEGSLLNILSKDLFSRKKEQLFDFWIKNFYLKSKTILLIIVGIFFKKLFLIFIVGIYSITFNPF